MQFVDLKRQYMAYKDEIDKEIKSVLDSAAFINGRAIKDLEDELVRFNGGGHAIACSSGTDALLLPLIAKNIKPGDEILVPAFTFIATATMVMLYKAKPVFIDVDPVTFTMNPECLSESISDRTVGIIPVSLYGQCSDMDEINRVALDHGLWVMEDAAQSLGAELNGRKSCTLSELATTSFFPAKPLGGYGDGGAVFTDDKDMVDELRSIRNHGQEGRYNHVRLGLNARMDTIQAAVIMVKLKHFTEELERRDKVATIYSKELKDIVEIPQILSGNKSSWAQYTIRTDRRDELRSWLTEKKIPVAVHYPKPLNRQPVFAHEYNVACPVSEELSERVLSLPMHPFLKKEEILQVTKAIKKFYE